MSDKPQRRHRDYGAELANAKPGRRIEVQPVEAATPAADDGPSTETARPVEVTIPRHELLLAMHGVTWLLGYHKGASHGEPLPSGVKRDVDSLSDWAGISEPSDSGDDPAAKPGSAA